MNYKLNSGSTNFIPLQCALEATTHIFFTLNTPEHGCSSTLSWPFSSCVPPPPPVLLVLCRRRHRTLFVLLLLLVSKQREALLFLEFLQDLLCKTALALGVHAQELVGRHSALAQARLEVARLLLHAVLVPLGLFIALSEPGGMLCAQGIGRELLLLKGSTYASDVLG